VTPDQAHGHDEEMACRELVELVTDYLEGSMPQSDRRRFDAHLEQCPDCLEYLEQMRQIANTIGQLSEESIAAERREELLAAFRGWRLR
jgi:anti-sigma factor RsiW